MRLIKAADVIVPKGRQREVSEKKVLELRASFKTQVGLINPIFLQNDGRTLLAGEHRLLAVRGLDVPEYIHDGERISSSLIPYTLACELNPDVLLQAELEENLLRHELSWQERTKAIAALFKLRQTQSAEKSVTFKEVATELRGGEEAKGAQIDEVSNAVLLAEFLDDPFVAAARTPQEARKIIKEDLKDKDRRKRMAEADLSSTRHRLIHGDWRNEKPPEGLFDVIVTDPPYGIDADSKDTFDASKHEYDDSDDYFTRCVLEVFPEMAFRAAKPNAHIYVFGDVRRFNDLFVAFELAGWTCWPRPLIWDKGNTGSYGNIEYGFRSCYDIILFARKGDRKVTAGYRDVIPITQPTNLAHPAGKPVELFKELLKRSALPGDTVADFFCGSGPIFPAAHDLGLTAYGWEVSDKYIAMAKEALSKLK